MSTAARGFRAAVRAYNYSVSPEPSPSLASPKPYSSFRRSPHRADQTRPAAMPEDGPRDAAGGSTKRLNLAAVFRAHGVDLDIADVDDILAGILDIGITEKFWRYPLPPLGHTMVDPDLDANKFPMLDHAGGRIHEGSFHCISTPNDVPEVKKVLKGLYGDLGLPFIITPKNDIPEVKKGLKEFPELWSFDDATYPQTVPGKPRLYPSLYAIGTPTTSGNSTIVEFTLLLDSGAGHHVVYQAEVLINRRDPPPGLTKVKSADGALLPVSGFGDIQTKDFFIPDVCLVQGLKANLLSVGQLAGNRKISLNFDWEGCEVISNEDGSLLGTAVRQGDNNYKLNYLIIQ